MKFGLTEPAKPLPSEPKFGEPFEALRARVIAKVGKVRQARDFAAALPAN